MPDRVEEQVRENPAVRLAAAHQAVSGGLGLQPDVLRLRDRISRGHSIRDDVGQRNGTESDLQSPRVDPGQLEQVVHQAGDAIGLRSHPPVVVGPPSRDR